MKFCSLYSGSSGNSIFVGSEKAKILIDAGKNQKYLETALNQIKEKNTTLKGKMLFNYIFIRYN